MKILYYRQDNKLLPGVLTEKGVIAVNSISGYFQNATQKCQSLSSNDVREISNALNANSSVSTQLIPETGLVIGPCVPFPSKIICIGLNYRRHAQESGMSVPAVPVVFTKYSNTLVDYGHNVVLGDEGEQFDYEVELGVVIGKKCKNVKEADALNYVLGYCVANDLSCRDLQFKTSQWLLGKSLDHFLPLGKYLVTADEVGDPQNLKLGCMLNGQLRQSSNTTDMIFPVAEIIAFLSRHMTLEPGDLILTGTPEGVIMGLSQKNWLKSGDVVRVEIEKLGYSENMMA